MYLGQQTRGKLTSAHSHDARLRPQHRSPAQCAAESLHIFQSQIQVLKSPSDGLNLCSDNGPKEKSTISFEQCLMKKCPQLSLFWMTSEAAPAVSLSAK